MNWPFVIARKIVFHHKHSFSGLIIRLSAAATAISVMAMIITVSFVNGFQKTISGKIYNFWGELRLESGQSSLANTGNLTNLTLRNPALENKLLKRKDISTFRLFSERSGVIEKNGDIDGIIFRGVDLKKENPGFNTFLKKGKWPSPGKDGVSEVIISADIAQDLKVKVSDVLNLLFIKQGEVKAISERIRVAGIYQTGIEEFDKVYILGDIGDLGKIFGSKSGQAGGYEVFLKDNRQTDSTVRSISKELPDGWIARSIQEIYPNLFDWLNIQDINRNVIFIVMTIVALINLISCLIILILERTRMIGTLKALGARNWQIQKIFLYEATLITLGGIFIGFITGIGLCLLEEKTGFIKLDEANYYVSSAPVFIQWGQVFLIMAGTAVISFLSLMLPSLILRKIRPVDAMRFQ